MTALTPELLDLADLRLSASAILAGKMPAWSPEHEMRLRPAVVLALLDRIEALEADLSAAHKALGHSYQQQSARQHLE